MSTVDGKSSHVLQQAATREDVEASIKALETTEALVTQRLEALASSHRDLLRELNRLDLLRANLGINVGTARSISNGMLSDAASTANRISSAVKRLDLEQSRVESTLGVVEQVVELKACVLGVHGSMGASQDWEKAASYLSRASQIPPDIIRGSFAEEIVPTADVPDPPGVTLEHAAESLCILFLREFEKAAEDGDGAKVTRFFKLFPLIGRSDTGLDIYSRYVRQGVSSRARTSRNAGTGGAQSKEGFFYANVLTKLFEHIAQIVEGHGSLVERHYGAGKMARVMAGLQQEADVQGGITIDTWSDERTIDRKLTDIRSYAFSFLVQSFLPAPRPAAGTPRAGSPAKRETTTRNSEDEGVDMREVDSILSEAAVMLARWSLYVKFVSNKAKISPDEPLTVPQFILDSNLTRKISDRLIGPFDAMTTFFFRRSIEKAFQLDESPSDLSLSLQKPPASNPPFITSAVDDTMYIVNKVIQRTLATAQRAVAGAVIPTIARVLGSDFVGMIQRKMRDESFPRAPVQGMAPPDDKTIAFIVLINSLDVATDYLKRIIRPQTEASSSDVTTATDSSTTPLTESFPFANDATFVFNTLHSLETSFAQKTSEHAGDGLQVLFGQVIKPKLRPLIVDAFRDVDYLATDEDLAERARIREEELDNPVSEDELVRFQFARSWEALMLPIKRILTERNYDKLLATTLQHLASKILEKRLWAYQDRVNELGAVRLERDVSAIANVTVQGEKYALREVFARCMQICLVMNMEEEEWEDMSTGEEKGEDSGIVWRLDADERARARNIVRI